MSSPDLELQCPHCQQYVIVRKNELNCCIFRHAAFLANLAPIPPHTSEAECVRLLAANLVVGCAKPFRVVVHADGTHTTEVCGYI
jgi:hypothetical protein